jgi:hypothetical protein
MRNRTSRTSSRTCGPALLLFAALILAAPPIGGVGAQAAGPEQIEQWLQEAAQIYEQLRPVAQQLGDRTLLQRMETLHTQWVAARGHMQGQRYQQAGQLARQNLEQMRALSTTVRRLAQRLPFYNRMAERNRELLQLLRQRIGPDAPREVQRQLTLTADALERAHLAHQGGNLVQAFRLMEQCDGMLRQVLQQADRAGLDGDAVRSEIEETDLRLEELAARGDLTPAAGEAVERARLLQTEARQQLQAGQLRLALGRTLSARTALRLAQRLSGSALSPDDVATAIDHAQELREMHTDLAAHPNAEVRALWNQAGRQLELARRHLEEGHLPAALEAAQSSAKLTLSAARKAGGLPPIAAVGTA